MYWIWIFWENLALVICVSVVLKMDRKGLWSASYLLKRHAHWNSLDTLQRKFASTQKMVFRWTLFFVLWAHSSYVASKRLFSSLLSIIARFVRLVQLSWQQGFQENAVIFFKYLRRLVLQSPALQGGSLIKTITTDEMTEVKYFANTGSKSYNRAHWKEPERCRAVPPWNCT